jgi:hypothetical protein
MARHEWARSRTQTKPDRARAISARPRSETTSPDDLALVSRMLAGSPVTSPAHLLALQRMAGNQVVQRQIAAMSTVVQRNRGGSHKIVNEDEPPIQRVVTPTFPVNRPAPTRSNSDASTTEVKEQDYAGTVKRDDAKKAYTYDFTSFTSNGEIQIVYYTNDHYPAPTPTDDSGTLSNVTETNWREVATDLHANRTGIADDWSAFRAEILHEDYHWQTEWVNALTPRVRAAEDKLKEIKVPFKKGPFSKSERTLAEAEPLVKKKAKKILDKAVKDAKKAYAKLGDSPGDPPYVAQAPAIDQLEARVRNHAAGQGWT